MPDAHGTIFSPEKWIPAESHEIPSHLRYNLFIWNQARSQSRIHASALRRAIIELVSCAQLRSHREPQTRLIGLAQQGCLTESPEKLGEIRRIGSERFSIRR